MDNEFCFLLSCIRAYFTNTSLPEYDNICWTKLFQHARHKKIMLFLYHILQKHIRDPDPRLQKCYEICEQKKKRNLFLAMELVKLHKVCQKQGVEIVCFKGPVLADLVYDNLALRDFNDIDILIDKNDIQQVEEILQKQGLKPLVDLDDDQRRQLLLYYHHAILWRTKKYSIDIHLQLHAKYFDYQPSLWRNNLQKSFANITTLSNEVYVVYLCTHAMRHGWQQLTAIIDIAFLLRKFPDLNWEQAIEYARKKDSLFMFYAGLVLCREWTNIHIPKHIAEKIALQRKLPLQVRALQKNMLAPSRSLRDVFWAHDSLWINFRTYLLFVWTPLPATIEKVKLPVPFYFLYPYIQIMLFILQMPLKLCGIFLRDKEKMG